MRFCRWLVMPLLLAISVLPGSAGPQRNPSESVRDVLQTIEARQLLADDPDLAAWNIGVTIRDRVATLWGPVPSAEAAFRAELCLRSIIELADVRNELFVSEALQPMRVPLKIDNLPLFPPQVQPPLPNAPRSNVPPPGMGPKPDAHDPFRPWLIEGLPAVARTE